MPLHRVAVALSGGGRTLANLLAKARGKSYEIAAVIASSPDCKGIAVAREANLPVLIAQFGRSAAPDLEARLYEWLASHALEWIALAGFLKPFPLNKAFTGRIVNIHPALLPAFGGLGMYGDRVHQAVIASGVQTSGATVHFVSEAYDEGNIIAQIEVPVLQGDDVHKLATRVFEAECELYPQVLNKLVRGQLPLANAGIERYFYDATRRPDDQK